MLAIGLISVVGQYLIALGYSLKPASSLAPLTYTQLVWSTLGGELAFGAIPSAWTWAGATLVVGAGIYVVRREHVELLVPPENAGRQDEVGRS